MGRSLCERPGPKILSSGRKRVPPAAVFVIRIALSCKNAAFTRRVCLPGAPGPQNGHQLCAMWPFPRQGWHGSQPQCCQRQLPQCIPNQEVLLGGVVHYPGDHRNVLASHFSEPQNPEGFLPLVVEAAEAQETAFRLGANVNGQRGREKRAAAAFLQAPEMQNADPSEPKGKTGSEAAQEPTRKLR